MTAVTSSSPSSAVDALTADGAIVVIRPVTAADTDAVTDLFGRSSAASLRLRFFVQPGDPVLAAEVVRLVRPASPDHGTLAAELAGEVVGVASYERRRPTATTAEFALFVADRHQGRGIGTLLLEHLALFARRHGIRKLTGEVLAGNARMLRVAGDLSASATSFLTDGVVEVSVTTTADEATLDKIDARDRTAGRASLTPLFTPRSVAVVGAGREPGGVGHEILQALVGYGFTGRIHPVNPHAGTVAGLPAYPSLRDLPGPVDLVVVAVPAEQVAAVIADAGAAGARAAVLISAGFGETGGAGAGRQAEVLRLARRHGIRLVGPNCLGVVNTDPDIRLDASFGPAPPRRGGLAVAAQSGAVGITVLDHVSRAGAGISSFVSLGNKADVSGNDLLSYWYDDPATTAVALYLESFGNPRRFARVARALARRKPVLAVVSGRTDAGRRAGASHTAAAAGPSVAVDSLFAQAGVIRADDLGELIDAARVLTDQPLPAGDRLAVVGNGGGVNVLAADAAEACGLRLPTTVAGLANPHDLGAGATGDRLAAALAEVAASGEVDMVVAAVAASRATDLPALRAAVHRVAAAHPRLPFVAVELAAPAPAPDRATAADPGTSRVPTFDLPERAVRALRHAVRYADWRRQPLGSRPALTEIDQVAARAAVTQGLTAGGGWQPYERSAAVLTAYDIPVLPSRTVHTAAEATAAARTLGYPVVLKSADPQLVHKSDVGAVKLDLTGPAEVETAYREIAAAVGRRSPAVLVQPMVTGSVELVAGIVHDPQFGSLVMVGLGGVHTELLDDRAFRLVPVTDLDAGRMWRSLRSAPLLTGYRGSPPVDSAAVEELLLRLGRLAEDLPQVAELDLNPVIAGPDGVIAVDAALRLAPTGAEPDPVLRRLR